MMARPEQSRCRQVVAFNSPERRRADEGFTLIEVLICTLILTVGMLAIAGLLLLTTQMQIGAQEAARSTRLAQDKIDELSTMDFATDPEIAVGGDLDADVDNYSEAALDDAGAVLDGVTLRWAVAAGPTADLRVVTLRVVNLRAQQYRDADLTTILRDE